MTPDPSPLPDRDRHLKAARVRFARLADDLKHSEPGSSTEEHIVGRLREALDGLDEARADAKRLARDLRIIDEEAC